jgi:pilus assembly protein TadC
MNVAGWLAVWLALTLFGSRRSTPRHRIQTSRRGGMAELAGLSVGALSVVIGGRAGLVAAPLLAIGCTLATRRVAATRRAPASDPRSVAFALDLVSAMLASGAPPEVAMSTVAAAADRCGLVALADATAPLRRVGRLLELGAEPEAAWADLAAIGGYGAVAAAGTRCASSGARLAGALAAVAVDVRQRRHAAALGRAQRVGVWALLPLGLCFLPAFICLGVVPVVTGVAGQVLSGVPS